jgi:hypothetical protein
VLAAAEIARDAQRLPMTIDDDHGVDAILVTLPAMVFDGLAGSIYTGREHQRLDLNWFQRNPELV